MARLSILHAQQRHDIAGLGDVQLLSGVRMHLNDAADALGFAGIGIQDGVAFLQLS